MIGSGKSQNTGKVWPDKFTTLKDEINPKDLESSWERLLQSFETETEKILEKGPSIIPEINFEEIEANNGKIPENRLAQIKHHGVLVIRNVVDKNTALKFKQDVQKYITRNRDKIRGFPLKENPQVWEVYWSKPQFAARSHPNFQKVTNALNNLWHADEGTSIDLETSVTYCDRLRIRQPGDTTFRLREHIDGGSAERWEDPEFRKYYQQIFNGQWELHDAYDATNRAAATLYKWKGACSVFRTFQGWMSLSGVVPGGGTLRVCPLIKHSTAYVLLRPFLPDIRQTPAMTGGFPAAQQSIRPDLYPHILKAMVSIPRVSPGDCVFWHCDMVHGVEPCCGNPTDSSVFYIPATPLCKINAAYLAIQKETFINGTSPPDFLNAHNGEATLNDRALPEELNEFGQLSMGFKTFPVCESMTTNAQLAAKEANKILFGFDC